MYNENDPDEKETKKVNYALRGSIERSLYRSRNKSIGILPQGSFAPSDRNECKYYYGGGFILNSIIPTRKENNLGIFCNRTIFQGNAENTMEITWKYRANDRLTFQPTVHCIKTGSETRFVGGVRMSD